MKFSTTAITTAVLSSIYYFPLIVGAVSITTTTVDADATTTAAVTTPSSSNNNNGGIRLLQSCDCPCGTFSIGGSGRRRRTASTTAAAATTTTTQQQQQQLDHVDDAAPTDKTGFVEEEERRPLFAGRALQDCDCEMICGSSSTTVDGATGDVVDDSSVATAGQVAEDTSTTSEEQEVCATIADVVCDAVNDKHFSTLCSLVSSNPDIAAILSSSTTNFTVFAPTNDAFDAVASTVSSLTTDQVVDVLLYHVVAGQKVFSSDLECGGEVEMAVGQNTVTQCGGDDIFQVGTGNVLAPKVISPDVDVCNGVIHVVNNVILPSTPSEEEPAEMVDGTPSPGEVMLTLTAAPSPSKYIRFGVYYILCFLVVAASSTFVSRITK